MQRGDTSKLSLIERFKSLSASPAGLLTLQQGRGGIVASSPGAFAGSGYFGFPRSSFMDGYYYTLQNASYAYMWQTQPNLRTVVGYLAANWAQVACKLYAGDDDDRQEDALHSAAASIRRPNDWQDDSELMEAFASDYFVFDNAYLIKIRPPGADKVTLIRVPAYAMGVRGVNKLRPDGYRIVYADGTYESLTPDEVIHWRGYNALDPRSGWAKLETLRQELISEAMRMQADIEFSKGGRVKGGIIERPVEAPEWSPEAAERFEEGWANRAKGLNAGKSPVLEDGMTWVDAGVTPREAEAIASKEASFASVCRIYGIHPALFGGGNLAELDAARKMVNEEVLPPLFKRCAGVLTRGIVEGEYGDDTRYFRFDMTEKVEGNVLERLKNAVTIAGGAFVTRNEVRAMFGFPPTPGGDELMAPANVLIGGQPSPHVLSPSHSTSGAGQEQSPEQVPNVPGPGKEGKADGPVRFTCIRPPLDPTLMAPQRFKGLSPEDGEVYTKAVTRRAAQRERKAAYAAEHSKLIRRHFNRQAASLKGKAEVPRLDTERWNDELAADLLALATKTVQAEGDVTARRLMGEFDPSQVEHYLEAGAKAAASAINEATQGEVERAVKAASLKADPIEAADGALSIAAGSRADQAGETRANQLAGFAIREAASQNPGEGATIRLKEWVWSGSANSRHGGLAGEAVPVYSPFSNGMDYPGDPSGGIEETARCACDLDVY